MRLLDRDVPQEYLDERTLQVAAEKKKQLATATKSVVIFRVASEWWALPTRTFQSVEEASPLHTLPHQRNGIVNGVVNIRGELLLSISLARLLLLNQTAEEGADVKPASATRFLICSHNGWRVVFPVNEVRGVHRYHPEELRETPITLAGAGTGAYIVGTLPWDGKTVGCMDDERLFHAVKKGVA